MSIGHNVRYGVHSNGLGQGSVPWQIPVQEVTNMAQDRVQFNGRFLNKQ